VHFLHDDPPDLIARKALRTNLSDLTAKGAVPRAYMLDIMLPKTVTEEWIAAFARGLADDQHEYGVHLIGGDTDSTPGPVTIAIMGFGDIVTGRMLRRGGARAGDAAFVTGTIGDAALGLAVLRGKLANPLHQAASRMSQLRKSSTAASQPLNRVESTTCVASQIAVSNFHSVSR
jgi:thiamine-monophosphate kinase